MPKIYESPDKGKTVYEREFGDHPDTRVKVKVASKREQRVWGNFANLFEDEGVKVKELVVDPGKGMSYQKHFQRSEIWLVSEGKCDVYHDQNGVDDEKLTLQKHEHMLVPVGSWHQIANPYEETCKIIEIQYGDACDEEDILRRNYYEDIHTN